MNWNKSLLAWVISLISTATLAQKPNILIIETLSVAIVQEHTKYFRKNLSQLGVEANIEVFNGHGKSEVIKDFLQQRYPIPISISWFQTPPWPQQ